MSRNSQEQIIFDQLLDVFEQIGSALKVGRITGLDDYSKLQDGLRTRLESIGKDTDLSEAKVKVLVLAAKRNERLLKAAMAGIKSATLRKSEIHKARQSSQTYSRTGNRIHLDSVPGSCEKRS